jgi:hypothetical protein
MILRPRINDIGTTALEFALVASLFLTLVFAIIDFGWYFFVQHTLQYATREGARLGTVGRTLGDSQGNPLSLEQSIEKTIRENASLAIDPDDPNRELVIRIFPVSPPGYSDPPDWQSLPIDAGGPGDTVRIRTRYNHRFLTPLIGAFFEDGGIPIQAQTTYRNELF